MHGLIFEPKEYVQGLSDRSSIPSNAGMLFVLPGETRPIFWMKAMHFPLDIIWIRDKRVIDINENLPVPTGNLLPTYSPKDNADMVLEVPAGSVARKRLAVGDVVVVDDAAITKQAQERDQP
ncbi:DUF192 domain-containing protein [Candidatus Gottesmanbacteria bacterium]|nr:DUF192 domain-containing protein [Candidatus Gottesmanbacteria bacterium]